MGGGQPGVVEDHTLEFFFWTLPLPRPNLEEVRGEILKDRTKISDHHNTDPDGYPQLPEK